jgi:hypothetical protein
MLRKLFRRITKKWAAGLRKAARVIRPKKARR